MKKTDLMFFLGLSLLVSSCALDAKGDKEMHGVTDIDYKLVDTAEVLVTSESGDKIARKKNVAFKQGYAQGNLIVVRPDIVKQTIDGIGTSFTESSAFVLAHLDKDKRQQVMNNIYSEEGANFTLARTPIGATDFSVEGKHSYDDVKGDAKLEHFSIAPDKDGFQVKDYPGIRDTSFDVLPMIKEANAIKQKQNDDDVTIIASAWTAPSWMKDIETWYIPGADENNWQGTGGQLKPEYLPVFAEYLTKYLDAYKNEGVDIWGLTPVNEPLGNNGQWESMHFSAESQGEFVKDYLGPALQKSNNADVKLLVYDQNRDHLEHWADVILSDAETANYVYGIAVHWYSSTFKVYEDVLNKVHDRFPGVAIINTEATIDDLGKKAPGGILDPERFQESDWFDNDAFWWNDNATDWAYTATWQGVVMEDHPIYTPVHRYARNIIVSLNNWMTGWVDWNIVLDKNGGPNHVGNFCGAPIMIDVETQNVYYTPVYYVLAQFSRTIRPGDKAVQAYKYLDGLDDDAIHASATINADQLLTVQLLNTTKQSLVYMLQIGMQYAEVNITANSVQTVRIQL